MSMSPKVAALQAALSKVGVGTPASMDAILDAAAEYINGGVNVKIVVPDSVEYAMEPGKAEPSITPSKPASKSVVKRITAQKKGK